MHQLFPLIYAFEEENVALTGKGTLDGMADMDHWLPWKLGERGYPSQAADRAALVRYGEENVPVSQRVFGEGHYLRPQFVQPYRCKNVLIQGVRLVRSPMWEITPCLCQNVIIRGVTIQCHGYNNDGCDPESCTDVLVEDCYFDTGDDCIAIKSGRNADGLRINIPTSNMVIRRNHFAMGNGGITMGSEISGGVKNIFAFDNKFDSPKLCYVLRLKTNSVRGGVVENVYLKDNEVLTCGEAVIHGTMMYEEGNGGPQTPMFKNITLENMKSKNGRYGIYLDAYERAPVTGLRLINVQMEGVETPVSVLNVQDPVFENVTINGERFPKPTRVAVHGLAAVGNTLTAGCDYVGGKKEEISFHWVISEEKNGQYRKLCQGPVLEIREDMLGKFIKAVAVDEKQSAAESVAFAVIGHGFADCVGHACEEAVNAMLSRGVVTKEERFRPDDAITRRELAVMLTRLWGYDGEKEPRNLLDMDAGMENYYEISAAVRHDMMWLSATKDLEHDILREFPLQDGGYFCPEETIRNGELSMMVMNSSGMTFKKSGSSYNNAKTPFADDRDVTINRSYIVKAHYFGLMVGDENNNFHPQENATRGEVAQILLRIAKRAAR